MKNYSYKVLIFISLSFFSLLIESLFASQLSLYWPLFSNVDILSDIKLFPEPTPIVSKRSVLTAGYRISSDSLTARSAYSDSLSFNQYLLPGVITNFKTDTTRPVLSLVMKKLDSLKSGAKVKVRIAWFGDSLIEGDLITQTVRELLQDNFSGNHGVGFVPFKSITSGFRISAIARSSGTWVDDNFKSRSFNDPLFLSGHVFYSPSGRLSLRDNTVKDSSQVLEKWLICGPVDSNTVITVNKSAMPIAASRHFNRILIDRSQKKSINLTLPSKWTALYGVSCEPEYGVMIDNFSFRGISGFELGRFDQTFLDEIAQSGAYDLIVIQYGVNVMFRAHDKNYDYYLKGMDTALKKLKQHFPHTEFLMVSCSDRAFRYGTEWKTAVGMDSLLKTQATLAYNNGITFFNLYQTMGGNGTIVKWAEGPERLASKDYIHPSPRGAVILGNLFYDAFMNDYHKLPKKSVL
jgi:lysophospholipase L1-like esterase